MSSLPGEVIVALTLSAGAIAFVRTRPRPDRARSGDAFQGVRSRGKGDYFLLVGTLIGAALHALIAPAVLNVSGDMSWKAANDVFMFWTTAGPAIAMWCALCLAVRWMLRGGLTADGKWVWVTLVALGLFGWPMSAMAVFDGLGPVG